MIFFPIYPLKWGEDIYYVMQPHEKGVKLFAGCLFSLLGSRKPFLSNKRKQFTPEDVNFRNLILDRNLRDFNNERIKATSSIILKSNFHFSIYT